MVEEAKNINQNIIQGNITNLIGIGTKAEDFEQISSGKLDFTILGVGNFGYTEKMKSKLNNKIYAVKKLPIKNKNFFKELFRETTNMLNSNNEYIVKLYGYFQGLEKIEKLKIIYEDSINRINFNDKNDIKVYFLILEYVPNGTLESYIKQSQHNKKIVPQDFVIKIFKQLLIALKYLYENKIMHRDIKSDNILLDENYNAKLGDFGLSALHRDNIELGDEQNLLLSNSTRVGRKDFVAPEILKGMECDYKIDVFCLGLTMLCLVTSKHPISLKAGNRQLDIKIEKNIYEERLIKLIESMILENPIFRPNAAEALDILIKIENYIKDPSEKNKNILDSPTMEENIYSLYGIGTKPEDFESIKSGDKEYTILGKGAFGYAEKMKSKLNNKFYAIKRLPVEKVMSKNFIRETNIMIQLNHMNIVRLYGYFQGYEKIEKLKDIYNTDENDKNSIYYGEKRDKKMFFLVLEYIPNESLESFKKKYKNKAIEQNCIIKIFRQILLGLKYLHERDVMHRDIKLDNILLDENYNIKITDFGISAIKKDYEVDEEYNSNRIYQNLFSNFTRVGHIKFAAPEIIKHKDGMKNDFDCKVDIYSLGLTMLCLISYDYPISLKEKRRIIEDKYIYPNTYNIYLIYLIKKMYVNDPNIRPTARDVLKELDIIEKYIKDPSNQFLKNKLDNLNQTQNNNNCINNPQNNMQINMQSNMQNNMQNNMQSNMQNNMQNNNMNMNYNFYSYPIPNINNMNNGMNNNNNYYPMSSGYDNSTNYTNYQGTNYNGNNNYMNSQINGQNYLYNAVFIPKNFNLFSPNVNFYNNFLNSGSLDGLSFNNHLSMSSNLINSYQFKNTSLLCILKVLCYLLQEQIQNVINTINFSDNNQENGLIQRLLYVISFMKNEPKNSNEILYLNNNIQIFRRQIATIISEFNGSEEIRPYDALREIYVCLCNSSRKFNNHFKGSILKDIKYIPGINLDISKQLDSIIATLSPFFDYFNFVFIDLIICPRCSYINQLDIRNSFHLDIDASISGNISFIIFNYINKLNNEIIFKSCRNCGVNGRQRKNISFLVRPKYLVFCFIGKIMGEKNLENIIDLSQYSYQGMNYTGPKKYSLIAIIKKNNNPNNEYCAFIKIQNIWYFYDAKNMKKCDYPFFENIFPYIVIYKGEN